jgi:hypothetical protein
MKDVYVTPCFVIHDHLDKIYDIVNAWDDRYQPDVINLMPASLQLQLTAEKIAFRAVINKAHVWIDHVQVRQSMLKPIYSVLIKLYQNLISGKASYQVVADIEIRIRKIKSVSYVLQIQVTPDDPDTPTDESIEKFEVVQKSIQLIVDNLKGILQLLTLELCYIPNDADISVEAIEHLINSIEITSKAAKTSYAHLLEVCKTRDELIFGPDGNVERTAGVVDYAASVFGTNSKEYQQVEVYRYVTPD